MRLPRRARRPSGYAVLRTVVNAAFFVWLLAASAWGAEQAKRLVVIGDSLTAGLGLERPLSFPARLELALRAGGLNVVVVNAGVSGDTTAGGLARLEWALAPVDGRGVDAVIIELGANDGLRGLDPGVTRANLDAMLTHLSKRGLPVLLAGMLAPPNLGRAYGQAFRAVFPDLAKRHGVALYPFFLEGVATVRALNQDDGLHPNARGVDVIVERILPYVLRLLSGGREHG